jgi:hypothetical protein
MGAVSAFLGDDAFQRVDPFFGFLRIGIGRVGECVLLVGHDLSPKSVSSSPAS